MALEDLTGTKYIDDLVSTNPAAGDNVSEGDDHIRGIKNVLKTTFPSIDGAITATDTEINYVDGVTSNVQTQFNAITADDWVTTARIADGAVDTARLGADAVTGAKIADDAINSEHYTDGSIDTAHIADGQITVAKMATNSVDTNQYVDGSIETAHIGNSQITVAKMAADSVDSAQYVDGSIDTAHIADAQITAAKLSSSMGDCSQKGFTAIGLDGGDYIGFNNNSSHSYFVNGAEEMRLEADGDLHVDGDVIAYSTTISDATLKYDINPVEFALDKINQLKGVSYKYKHNDRESAGLLAQDVEKVMPSAVNTKKLPLATGDDKEYKTLHYDSMTAILVEAIKELTAKVKKLESK